MTGLVSATIDLAPFYGATDHGQPSRVLCGRDNAEKALESTGFNELLLQFDAQSIELRLKPETRSVNASFLEEFLRETVLHFGKAELLRRVTFSPTDYDIHLANDIDEAVDRIQRYACLPA